MSNHVCCTSTGRIRLSRQREPDTQGQGSSGKTDALLRFIAGQEGEICSRRQAISASSKAAFDNALKYGLIARAPCKGPLCVTLTEDGRNRIGIGAMSAAAI